MTEEAEQPEQTEQTETVEEQAEESNPVFDALFKTVETEGDAEDPEPDFVESPPASLHQAIYDIERGEDAPVAQEEEAPTEEAPAAKAPKPKGKVKVKPKVVDPDFKQEQRIPPTPRAQQQADPFVSELNEDERERYELARWASQNVKGEEQLADNYLNFFKSHKEYINKRLEDDPDLELGDDRDYRDFVDKNKPKVNVRQLEQEKWTQVAERRAMERMAPEINRLQREQVKIRNAPAAKKGVAEAQKLLIEAIPEDMREPLSTNAEEYAKANPFEVNVVNQNLQAGVQMTEAFYNILYELEDYDDRNPVHKSLSQFIDREQENFIQSGRTKRNGKTFVRRERFPHVPASEKDKYYTFTDDDIARLIAARTKENVTGGISQLRDQFAAAGYAKNGQPQPQAQPQAPVAQQNPPRPIQPTPMAGAALPAGEAAEGGKNPIMSLLDL